MNDVTVQNRGELGQEFERKFFGLDLAEHFHTGIPFQDWSYERALRDVILRNRYKHSLHHPDAHRTLLRRKIMKHITEIVYVSCAVHTVLDRDFGIDGFFSVRRHDEYHVVTFDLVLRGHLFNIQTQQADIRIAEVDLTPGAVDVLAKVIALRLKSDATIVPHYLFSH